MKEFLLKGDWIRHLNRKFPCKVSPIVATETAVIGEILHENTCIFCKKSFWSKFNLTRHLDGRCKTKKEKEITDILSKMEQLEKQVVSISNLKQEVSDIKKSLKAPINANPATINNNSHNITNNITNNTQNIQQNIQQNIIQINPFGKEKFDLTDKQLKRFLRKCYNSVPELINYKHFNEDDSELQSNCNVYIPNVKGTHAKVFTGDRWEIREVSDVIHQLFEDNNDYLIDQFKEKEEELDEMTKRKFSKYLSKQDDKKVIIGVKRNIKQNLYNKKHIPMSINK